jgi:hypothetical protein
VARLTDDGSIPVTQATVSPIASPHGVLGVTHLTHGAMQVQLLLDPDSGIELGEQIAAAYRDLKRGKVTLTASAPVPVPTRIVIP